MNIGSKRVNTSRVLLIAAIAFAVLFFLFNGFSSNKINYSGLDSSKYNEIKNYISALDQNPVDYLCKVFETKRIVCLGAETFTANGPLFVIQALPELYNAGVDMLAVDFALAEDNDRIKDLVTASEFSENRAREILFNRLILFGYKEYEDLLKTVWSINQNKPAGKAPMKLIGLSVKHDYSVLKTPDDLEDDAKLRSIIPGDDTLDSFMGKEAVKRLSEFSGKALVYTAFQHSFTSFHWLGYEKEVVSRGVLPDNAQKMGNFIYDSFGDECATVLMHTFWTEPESPNGLDYPAGGTIDKAISAQKGGRGEFGLTIEGSPLADLKITRYFAKEYDELYLKDMAYGYISMGPIKATKVLTPINDFINEQNLESAIYNFPGIEEEELTPKILNGYIANTSAQYGSFTRRFK